MKVGSADTTPNLAARVHEVRMRAHRIRGACAADGGASGSGLYRPGAWHRRCAFRGLFPCSPLPCGRAGLEGRDRFLLVHRALRHCSLCGADQAAVLPAEEWATYGGDHSWLPMSGMSSYTPGMEITGGTGEGLSVAIGNALGLKRKGSASFVYNLMSDGELNEGATWEAALSASHWRLDNLILLIDVNNQQADGPSKTVLSSSRWRRNGKPSACWCSVWTATIPKPCSSHSTVHVTYAIPAAGDHLRYPNGQGRPPARGARQDPLYPC